MKNKISKILGIGLSAGLIVGLIGTVFAAPVAADQMKWTIVNTPTVTDMVILPSSDILDYDIGGEEGDTIYAVLDLNANCTGVGDSTNNLALVKSTDGGVTWKDITAKLTGAANLPSGDYFQQLIAVAVAPDDEDWLAVAGYDDDGDVWVVASKDGGTNFSYTGDIVDGDTMNRIFDLAVSPEVDSIHNIAIAGQDTDGDAALFRLKAGTWLSASWDDTTDGSVYNGWDFGLPTGYDSEFVIACVFSPNFDIDDTIVIIIVEQDQGTWPVYYLQSGIWETNGAWASEAGFPNATEIKADGDTLALWGTPPNNAYVLCAGLALPFDYDGSDPGARAVFLYVNALLDPAATNPIYGGYVFRADNNALSPVCGPPGDPLLASIDVHGDADTGKLMIGEYIKFDNDATPAPGDFLEACCCPSVSVWHTEELDFCCPQWDGACKDPSGPYTAKVMYTPDGVKEYATTSGLIDPDFFNDTILGSYWSGDCPYLDIGWMTIPGDIPLWGTDTGTPDDETAFSVSRDDAVSFNQIGLIDTDIDYLSDFVACPDCGTYYLATINTWDYDVWGPCSTIYEECMCDSIWRSYDEGDTWERVNFGEWSEYWYWDPPMQFGPMWDLIYLRLPCDAVEDCCDQDPVSPSGTIYMGIRNTDTILYSRDCGQCWNDPPATKLIIEDFAVESENIVYVLDVDGYVSKSTQYGRRWSDPVDTGVKSGTDILACCEQGFVVVGGAGEDTKIGWSDDGGETWNLTDKLPMDGSDWVHVACDPACEDIIYAATEDTDQPTAGVSNGRIYRIDLSDGSVLDINAVDTNYNGIVMAREGTLYALSNALDFDTSPGVDDCWCLDRKIVEAGAGDVTYSGVVRNLGPCETDCCGAEEWDYLICGLSPDPDDGGEDFDMGADALDLCGCLSIDTNTVLFAIDNDEYDMGAYMDPQTGVTGMLWSYEDCAAKKGPILTSPADGAVLDCEPCAGCDAANFTLEWERMCLACSYDVVIMDSEGNTIVKWTDVDITGDPPSLFIDGTMEVCDDVMDYILECGETYTWKVREANTACECVHSPWSETWTFTVAVGAADAINLLAPTKGAMDVPINNIGFSWTSVRNATSYSFVLSPNANLAGALVSQDMSTTAFNYVGPLDYGKAYYWQIIAWADGTRLTTSAIGVFNTMAEPEEPTPPVVVEQTPAPVVNVPAAKKITPIWIYAVIGVGAALAVVVIVLIVRTRRP